MGIEVKHSGNVASTAVAAAAGGKAKRTAEATRDALSIIAGKKRGSGSSGTLNTQDPLADRTARDSARPQPEREASIAESISGPGLADAVAPSAMGDRVSEPDSNVGLEYSEKQRQEYNKLADAYDEAVASEDYNEEELADIRRQMDAKQLGIKPQKRMKKKSKWPEGQDIGQEWTMPDGSTRTRNEKGDIKPLGKAIKPGPDQATEMIKSLAILHKDVDGIVDWPAVKKSYEESMKILAEVTAEKPAPSGTGTGSGVDKFGNVVSLEDVQGKESPNAMGRSGGKIVTLADVQSKEPGPVDVDALRPGVQAEAKQRGVDEAVVWREIREGKRKPQDDPLGLGL